MNVKDNPISMNMSELIAKATLEANGYKLQRNAMGFDFTDSDGNLMEAKTGFLSDLQYAQAITSPAKKRIALVIGAHVLLFRLESILEIRQPTSSQIISAVYEKRRGAFDSALREAAKERETFDLDWIVKRVAEKCYISEASSKESVVPLIARMKQSGEIFEPINGQYKFA